MVGRSLVTMAALAAVAKEVAGASEYFTGDGTAYTLGLVSSGNCNFMSALSTASSNYAALNQAQWDSLANCGRCAEVSCIDSSCSVQNKTEVVQILDRCPECKSGDLDLSPTVFKSITGSDPSRLTIQWRFVECPNPGTIKVCLKEGSNADWVAVQPTNFAVGVESVTVAGAAATMLDGAYYFVDQSGSIDLSAVKVSITSINGDVVEGTYALTAGSCTDTGEQFASSGSSSSTTTSAPATTTAAPAATTAAPAATTAAPATTTSESGDDEYDDSAADDYDDQTDSTTGSTATEAPTTTTTDAPAATTKAPAATTKAPAATTKAPAATTKAPAATTKAPAATTKAPAATTKAPAATTAAPTSSGSTPSKCRVRSAK